MLVCEPVAAFSHLPSAHHLPGQVTARSLNSYQGMGANVTSLRPDVITRMKQEVTYITEEVFSAR